MDMRGALRARLLATPGINSAVGGRVTWLTRPQATGLPAITLQTISSDHPQHLQGFEKATSRVQLDVWAPTSQQASDIVAAAKTALAPGVVGNGVRFGRMFFEGESDFLERLGEKDIYRVSIDLIINHEQA